MENPSKSPSKDTYKVVNWKSYNESLKKRGTLTLWIEEKLLREWKAIDVSNKRVGEKIYPDSLILFYLTIGAVYGRQLRQTVEMLESLLALMGLSAQAGRQLDVAVDSTGLKVRENVVCGRNYILA